MNFLLASFDSSYFFLNKRELNEQIDEFRTLNTDLKMKVTLSESKVIKHKLSQSFKHTKNIKL